MPVRSNGEHRSHRRLVGVVVARQGSSRLPGKAMMELCGKPMIGHIIDRLAASPSLDQVTVATSSNPEDEAIATYAASLGIEAYRGEPEDLLARITGAAEHFDADAVIEVGGDCPFVDPPLLEEGIAAHRRFEADAVSNALLPPFTYPVGYEFVLVTTEALRRACREATLLSERHHPFQYLLKHPELFKIRSLTLNESLNHWRWTLDYPEDADFVRAVYSQLHGSDPLFGLEEIRSLLSEKPELLRINESRAEPVSGATVWYTGSYVREAHRDINRLLEMALRDETQGDYVSAVERYESAAELLTDLIRRGRHFASEVPKADPDGA